MIKLVTVHLAKQEGGHRGKGGRNGTQPHARRIRAIRHLRRNWRLHREKFQFTYSSGGSVKTSDKPRIALTSPRPRVFAPAFRIGDPLVK